MAPEPQSAPFLGRPVERVEDPLLLTGEALYADDWPERPGTLHAAILRSPYAHADIVSIDAERARARPGVAAVITGEDVRALSDPFLIVLRQPMDQWSLAIDRVRFVGESVAVVIAEDRYQAEDALEDVEVRYEPRDAVVDPRRAMAYGAPLLHPGVGSNVPSSREFSYGDPDAAFASADHCISLDVDYPRNSQTPLEGYVVMADYRARENVYDVVSNFQGPFTVHPVMSKALRVKGSQLRMRSPAFSGGGFGAKQAIFPCVVLMCLASKLTGRPVKWVEDRLEHLTAAVAAPNRIIRGRAAVTADGVVTALAFEQIDDYGAYLRPPMPGPLYRQHGIMTGAYGVRNLRLVNKVVMTNKTPSGMIRGFGGPQIYFAIERLMKHVADTLGIDHLDLIRRNLIPAGSFPYRAPAGALIDSGDYQKALETALAGGRLDALRKRRDEARAQGRLYGIGFAAVVEPAQSNMGYLSTINPAEYRERAGPKGGHVAYATVNVDPLGSVAVTADSLPQGQGHATILAQITADALGLHPDDVVVNMERDTQRDPWSIATGNYSSRFSSATAVAAAKAAGNVRGNLARVAAMRLNTTADNVEFRGGKVFARDNPDNAMRFSRVAGTAHWSPGELPAGATPGISETASCSAPELAPPNEKDQINTSLTYGFVFDFCGVEVDRDTGRVRIDSYVTTHDSGRLLNPLLADGQIYGAFGWGVGCALHEEFRYAEDGSFLSGTFADYLCPTACEVPEPEIRHLETPSPFTPLGAKGIAEGNCMSTPACIANAVCDATGISDLALPLAPSVLADLLHPEEPPPPASASPVRGLEAAPHGRGLTGTGAVTVRADVDSVWSALLDPDSLARIIPGCHRLDLVADNRYRADVSIGIGVVKARFGAEVELSDLVPPSAATLTGRLEGPFGASRGSGKLRLEAVDDGTRIDYAYSADVSGKVAAVGGRMLEGASRVVFDQFFRRLAAQVEQGAQAGPASRSGSAAGESWWRRMLRALGAGS